MGGVKVQVSEDQSLWERLAAAIGLGIQTLIHGLTATRLAELNSFPLTYPLINSKIKPPKEVRFLVDSFNPEPMNFYPNFLVDNINRIILKMIILKL